MTTTGGVIQARDAKTGALVWGATFGPGTCKINNGSNTCYTTSSPAIDPNRQYVYTYGLDGYAHKLQVGDGTEIKTGGWPQVTTTKGYDEKGSSALSFATVAGVTYLYVVHGGYPGDGGDYQGHVTAINLATGAQNVFNAACSDKAVHLDHYTGTVTATTCSAAAERDLGAPGPHVRRRHQPAADGHGQRVHRRRRALRRRQELERVRPRRESRWHGRGGQAGRQLHADELVAAG